MKIGIVAGEASGDLLGARLIQELRQHFPHVQIEGLGGPAMIAAGCKSLFDIERLSVMGLIEPLRRLPDLFKLRRQLINHFTNNKPDIFIGIDAPDFNLGLEIRLKKAGIPIVHYVSPSVWAWRQRRVYKIAKAVDLMLTLFPFEAKFYEKFSIPVKHVGHPLANQLPLNTDKIAARRALCIDETKKYVALLPGSRKQEIRYMAQPFLLAAQKAWEQNPDLKFLTSHINEQRYQEFFECYKKYTPNLPLEFFTRRSQDVMAAADVAIVTSGTATLETMLFKTPMVIAYRMPRLTYWLAKILVKIPYVGLPNVLAGEFIVPELIQDEVKPEVISDYILKYLDPEVANNIKSKFTELHLSLRSESAVNKIDAIETLFERTRKS